MTKPFTPRQKYRILVAYDAQVIVGDALVSVARYAYGVVSETRRYAMLRRELNCAVRCACGCGVWAPLSAIDFDHETPHVQTQRSLTSDGRPLRRTPCHVAKSAVEQKVTGKVTRVRNKLSVTTGLREDDSPTARTTRRSWPTLRRLPSRPFPKGSRPLRSRPFPQHQGATP